MNTAIVPRWWSVCTLRVSLIGIHMMFVDSLHINRWLCGDNVLHIVPTMMLPNVQAFSDVHSHLALCHDFFPPPLILMQSEGHLLISLFQKESKKSLSGAWGRRRRGSWVSPHIHTMISCTNATELAVFVTESCIKTVTHFLLLTAYLLCFHIIVFISSWIRFILLIFEEEGRRLFFSGIPSLTLRLFYSAQFSQRNKNSKIATFTCTKFLRSDQNLGWIKV